MKRTSCLVFALLVSLGIGSPSWAQSGVVTGKVVADELRDVVDSAKGSAQVLIGDIGIQAQAALERLERILGDKINTPIEQLDAGLRAEISATRGLAGTLRKTLDALPKCIGNEGRLLLAGVKSGLSTAMSNVPFLGGPPLAYTIEDASRQVPYVLKHTPAMGDRHLVLRGANLWSRDEVCEVTASAVGFGSTDKELPVEIISMDKEKIDLRASKDMAPGQYLVKVQARRKRFLGLSCSPAQTVAAGLSVVAPQTVQLHVNQVAACQQVERYAMTRTGGISANGCNTGSRDGSDTIVFDRPGFVLERFDFSDQSNSRGSAGATRAGDNVVVRYSAQHRGNTCSHGKGKGKYSVTLHGVKPLADKDSDGKLIASATLEEGASVPFKLAPPPSCSVSAYKLSADGRFNDGKPIALPPVTVSPIQSTTSNENGVRMMVSASAASGTLAMDPGVCL